MMMQRQREQQQTKRSKTRRSLCVLVHVRAFGFSLFRPSVRSLARSFIDHSLLVVAVAALVGAGKQTETETET